MLKWEYKDDNDEVKKKLASLFLAQITWSKFIKHVIGERRYQLKDGMRGFVDAIGEMSIPRHRTLKKGESFFRARIAYDHNELQTQKETVSSKRPFVGLEMQISPLEKRKAGRANANGVGVLYLASDEKTAIAEVRPWKAALVSVVRFDLVEDVKIVDLIDERKGEIPQSLWKEVDETLDRQLLYEHLWKLIDLEFAKPISIYDSELSYVPTQILAETFQQQGAGGVVYKSAMSDSGYNLVLFEESMAEQDTDSANLKVVLNIAYECKAYRSVVEKLQVGLEGVSHSQNPID